MDIITVIYDSDCAFCRWSVRFLDAWDKKEMLRFIPCQSEERKIEFPLISTEQCMAAMQAVLPDNVRKSGFDAIAHVMKYLTGWKKIAGVCMIYTPGATYIGRIVYQWVAKNRYKIKCDDDTCRI